MVPLTLNPIFPMIVGWKYCIFRNLPEKNMITLNLKLACSLRMHLISGFNAIAVFLPDQNEAVCAVCQKEKTWHFTQHSQGLLTKSVDLHIRRSHPNMWATWHSVCWLPISPALSFLPMAKQIAQDWNEGVCDKGCVPPKKWTLPFVLGSAGHHNRHFRKSLGASCRCHDYCYNKKQS